MKIKWIYTARDTEARLEERELCLVEKNARGAEINLPLLAIIDTEKQYQQMYGFGGAFTDTAAAALAHMEPSIQKEAIEAYFDQEKGLAYNMGRIPIGGCDFSSVPYSHAEVPGDVELKHHSIEQDKKGIIPFLKRAKECRCASGATEELLLYALPWSPPAWMKSNQEMNWGGRLLKEYYPVMADYIVKFLQSYEEAGIPIWGVAAQNEPIEIQRWASCEYSGEEERVFLKDHLIPALETAGYGDKKILFWDCNKDFLAKRMNEVLEDEGLRRKLFGAAFHWYSGDYFEELESMHEKYPETQLLETECCVVMPKDLNDWSVGERYAHEMIGDFNHWTCAWMDWNLFLDENSGPGIADNPCAAPIILNRAEQKLVKMSSYYYIGHFSRYIRRGAMRVDLKLTGSDAEHAKNAAENGLEACAFLNPDGSIVAVLMNTGEEPVRGTVAIGEKIAAAELGPHSIGTILIEK